MDYALEVDRKYKNRIGNIVTIVEKIGNASFKGNDGLKYGLVGVAMEKGASWDLVTKTEDGIGKMLHALGISHVRNGDYTRPNKRYSPYPESYRNYYQTSQDDDLDELVQKECVVKTKNGLDLDYYYVTEKGIEYLKSIGYKWHERDK